MTRPIQRLLPQLFLESNFLSAGPVEKLTRGRY